MAHDAFISYSSKDKPTADAACALLESSGVRCWIAPRDILPGRDWGESIVDAIAASRVMVLIFSAHANQSPQVRREVERAVDKGCAIVPFRIENVPPSKSLEYFISVPHWMDAYGGQLDEHLVRLAATVTTLIKHGDGQPTRAPVAARAAGQGPAGGAFPASAASSAPSRPGRWTPRRVAIGAGVTASAALAVFLGVRFLSPGPRAASAGTQPEKPTTAPAQIAPSGGTGGSTTAPEPKASPPPAPAPQDTSAADRALAARRQELETAARALKLTTIARIGRQQLCVIDGRPLREGDSYRGFVVQKVLGDRVVVVAEGMPFEVRPQPKAEPAPPPAHEATAAPTPPSPGGPRFYGPGGGGSPEGPGGPPPGGPGGPGGPPPPRGPRPPGPGGR